MEEISIQVDISFCKGRLYKFLFFLFFIYAIGFSFFCIVSSFAADEAESDKIQITADNLNINNEENYAEFIGTVKAVHKGMTIDSDRLKIYYDKGPENSGTFSQDEKSIEKIIAEGNVTIVSEDRIANADKADYVTKTGVLVLTGEDARITNGKNSITGGKIIFNRFLGNVKVVADPQKRVKAIFFANTKSSEFNLLESGKDDLNKAVVKDGSTKELESGINATVTQVAVADVIQDEVMEEAVFDESGEPDAGQATKIDVTGESDKIEVEDLADEHDGSTMVAALTVPGHGIKKVPKLRAIENPVLVYEEIDIGELKNKIGIIFTDQQDELGVGNYNTLLNDYIMNLSIEEFDDIIFLKLNQDTYSSANNNFSGNELSQFANNSSGLLKIGRDMGLNAIVIGTISDIFTENETRGILWFRDNYNLLTIKVIIDGYDTETGAKIFSENLTSKFDIGEADFKRFASEKTIDNTLLAKQLRGIAEKFVARIGDILTAQRWTGFFKSINKDNLIISSGRTTGLKPGNVLEVYDTKIIKGYQGKSFFLPDNKIGLVQVTEVGPDTSQAVLVAGTAIEDGCLIKPRQTVR
jgi:lipopolysaccharide export system protein LptA